MSFINLFCETKTTVMDAFFELIKIQSFATIIIHITKYSKNKKKHIYFRGSINDHNNTDLKYYYYIRCY